MAAVNLFKDNKIVLYALGIEVQSP